MSEPIHAGQSKLTITFGGAGLPFPAVCTLGISHPLGQPDVSAITQIGTDLSTIHQASCSADVIMTGIECKTGPSANGPTRKVVYNVAGQRGGTSAAANVALLVTKRVGGVSGRFGGRLYWPATPESMLTSGGVVDAGMRTQLQDYWNDLYASFGTGALEGFAPVVLDGSSDGRPIETFIVEGRTASQRRRQRR